MCEVSASQIILFVILAIPSIILAIKGCGLTDGESL